MNGELSSEEYETQLSKSLHETNSLIEKLSNLTNLMIETKNNIKTLDSIVKSVTQDCLQLIKVWNKSNGLKKMKKIQTNQKNTPKNEIIEVSEKMSEFLSTLTTFKNKDSYTKVNVTRAILDYIQTQELNKTGDIITFDEPLLSLFQDKTDASFFDLHKLIANHFIIIKPSSSTIS